MKKLLFATFLLTAVLCFVGLITAQTEEPTLKCDFNGDFVMLTVSDPQCENKQQWQQAKAELETLVEKCNPDFVLINGDLNTYNDIPCNMWDLFISPLTKRNIYWSTTNGNHDPFLYKYYRLFKSYPYCLNATVPATDKNYEPSRPMNYVLPVLSNDGKKTVFAIYGLDSGTKQNGEYTGVTQKQIEWYKTQSDKLKQKNGGKPITAVICMHIPVPQILEAYYSGETEIYGIANEINYNRNGYVCRNGNKISKINIHTSKTVPYTDIFETALAQNDVKAMFFGHNHRNNFIGSYQGVLLGFVGKLSEGCYCDTLCRGGRVLKFNQNSPENFTTEWIGTLPDCQNQIPIYSNGKAAN